MKYLKITPFHTSGQLLVVYATQHGLSLINCIRANFYMIHLILIHSINDDQLHSAAGREFFRYKIQFPCHFYVICDVWSVIKIKEKKKKKLLQFLVFNVISTEHFSKVFPLDACLLRGKTFPYTLNKYDVEEKEKKLFPFNDISKENRANHLSA